MTRASIDGRFVSWQTVARGLLQRNVAPNDVFWEDTRTSQLPLAPGDADLQSLAAPTSNILVPRAFVRRARLAACHRDPERWALLYRLLWRITHGERTAADDPLDADARLLATFVRQVRRDEHKMHAFVRFRKVADERGEIYVAFHRPDHYIVRMAAAFFVERFGVMRWSILTPDECAHWDGAALTFTPGVEMSAAPPPDELEDVWRTYYASIFNPARVNPKAMIRELPVRHWSTLPEAEIIPVLIADAPQRVSRMSDHLSVATSARPYVPRDQAELPAFRRAAALCRGCPLYADATQVVFGEGHADAQMMFVGEQPGDEEDRLGRPFVGPAGQILANAIEKAGLRRETIYVTNAVKHFRFRREGKRRIHERPRPSDVRACRPWLEAEIHRVSPRVIVCLGSTAAQALIGPRVRIQRDRGQVFRSHWAPHVMVTYHPSAVLRADSEQHSDDIMRWLIEDLTAASNLLAE